MTGLSYSAHPTAEAEMRRVAEKVAADYPVRALAAVHRVGDLAVGDLAVVVAVVLPAPRRGVRGRRRLIDDLKQRGADLEAPDLRPTARRSGSARSAAVEERSGGRAPERPAGPAAGS